MSELDIKQAKMVEKLAKPAGDINKSLTDSDCHLIHMVMGICGEAGELLDAVKKSVIYRKPLDLENVIEELGDIEFYMEGLRQELNVSRGYTLAKNQSKLAKRYGDTYSNESAQQRADKTETENGEQNNG